jgi:hypothetical protein
MTLTVPYVFSPTSPPPLALIIANRCTCYPRRDADQARGALDLPPVLRYQLSLPVHDNVPVRGRIHSILPPTSIGHPSPVPHVLLPSLTPKATNTHTSCTFLLIPDPLPRSPDVRSFCTPMELLQLLSLRFVIPDPPGLDVPRLKKFYKSYVNPIHLR